jgi:hypothetical protein
MSAPSNGCRWKEIGTLLETQTPLAIDTYREWLKIRRVSREFLALV